MLTVKISLVQRITYHGYWGLKVTLSKGQNDSYSDSPGAGISFWGSLRKLVRVSVKEKQVAPFLSPSGICSVSSSIMMCGCVSLGGTTCLWTLLLWPPKGIQSSLCWVQGKTMNKQMGDGGTIVPLAQLPLSVSPKPHLESGCEVS